MVISRPAPRNPNRQAKVNLRRLMEAALSSSGEEDFPVTAFSDISIKLQKYSNLYFTKVGGYLLSRGHAPINVGPIEFC